MAAFTTLALLGLAAAAGAGASKALAPKPTAVDPNRGTVGRRNPAAPDPTLDTPAPPVLASQTGAATTAATAAATRQRRRATGAAEPIATTGNAQPLLQPKTLLGS